MKIRFDQTLLAACLIAISLILADIFVDKPISIRTRLAESSVLIEATSSRVVMPDSWVHLQWELGPGIEILLNGDVAPPSNTIRAWPGDYEFSLRTATGSQEIFKVSIEAWSMDRPRVLLTGVALLILSTVFMVAGWKYFKPLYQGCQSLLGASNAVFEFRFPAKAILGVEIVCLMLLALFVHLVLWQAWPPHLGADTRSYVSFYVNVFESDTPVDFSLVYVRGLLPSLLHGWSLAQGYLLHLGLQTFLAATASLMVFFISRPWGRKTAILASLLYLSYLPFQLFYHQVNSEGVFAWCILFSISMLMLTLRSRRLSAGLLLGLGIGLCVLTRPTGLILCISLLSICLLAIPFLQKLRLISAVTLSLLLIVSPWIVYRGMRYGEWLLSRPQGTFLFSSTYTMGLIESENGDASTYLTSLLIGGVLQYPSYRDAGITMDDIYHPAKTHSYVYYNDMLYYLDMELGWEAAHNLLDQVGIEAVRTRPLEFVFSATRFIQQSFLNQHMEIYIPDGLHPILPFASGKPNEIPRYSYYTSHPRHLASPSNEEINRVRQRESELLRHLNHAGNRDLGLTLGNLWRAIAPPMPFIYVLVLLALFAQRSASLRFWVPVLTALFALAISSAIVSPELRYRMVIDPILLILAVIGAQHLAKLFYAKLFSFWH